LIPLDVALLEDVVLAHYVRLVVVDAVLSAGCAAGSWRQSSTG
jgi:hypothetical protein